jgi:hypothetical protein
MQDLPVSKSGWVVPWFVDWLNGEPEFRAMDPRKWKRAIKEERCWVCGHKLGSWLVFVIGPMCAINRVSSEPPSHLGCARWSAQNCPFLSRPHMIRREAGEAELIPNQAGVGIMRNPGVTLLWTTRDYEVFQTEGGPLIQVGEAAAVEWWAEGKPATRAQVEHSIETGLPALEELAAKQEGGMQALREKHQQLHRWLPAV